MCNSVWHFSPLNIIRNKGIYLLPNPRVFLSLFGTLGRTFVKPTRSTTWSIVPTLPIFLFGRLQLSGVDVRIDRPKLETNESFER